MFSNNPKSNESIENFANGKKNIMTEYDEIF